MQAKDHFGPGRFFNAQALGANGHAAVAAMNRGDTRGALDAISRAGDRAAKLVVGSAKPKKASSGGKRVGGGSRTARTPRAPAPPPARSSTPVKLTGGGGGGAAARQPAKQGQSAQVPQQLHDAGYPAKVLDPRNPDDGFKVVIGPYPTRDEADAAGKKLGRPYFVVVPGTGGT